MNREQRQAVKAANRKWPRHLVEVPRVDWPLWRQGGRPPERVLRSRDFLVQIYTHEGLPRLSVSRTTVQAASGRWADGIGWDELQQLKREAGYGDHFAVEVYPEDRNMANVANMRHLWILEDRLPFAWGRS